MRGFIYFIMKEIKLTQDKVALVDDADYDYLNQFKWYVTKGPKTFYAGRDLVIDGVTRRLKMHRIIMSTPCGLVTDHIDHNGLNNQRSNLRNCTKSQNQRNKTPIGSSKYLGVNICIRATIRINNKNVNIGSFKTEEEAARAYDKMAKIHFGEYANLNFK